MPRNIGKNRQIKLDLLSDDQVLAELGCRYEERRRSLRLPDQAIFANGGLKKDALANFKKGRNISLLNFIKILRGAKLMNELEELLSPQESFSPIAEVSRKKLKFPKHVHKSSSISTKRKRLFHWGDE